MARIGLDWLGLGAMFVGVRCGAFCHSCLCGLAWLSGLRSCVQARIEAFHQYRASRAFDIGIAFHACGSASDFAQLQCMRARAAYVMCPCCIGKLKFTLRDPPPLPAANGASPAAERVAGRGADGDATLGADLVGTPGAGLATPRADVATAGAAAGTYDRDGVGLLSKASEGCVRALTHPRSLWLRARLPLAKLGAVVAAADHSEYDFDDPAV